MSAYKYPIIHHWIKQTLVPFILFAFASTLPYPADISAEIQRSIDFALVKPDHHSDGDDVVFERMFMAIMHRHKNLAPDLTLVVDNLEPCAKYLIRRAQLKGPFELLERTDVASSTWIEHERQRFTKSVEGHEATGDELRSPVRPPVAAAKLPLTVDKLDPRLVHAQPGHLTAANLSGQLTAAEDSYYRQQNCNYEQARLQRQQQLTYTYTMPAGMHETLYTSPERENGYMMSVRHSPFSQQQPNTPLQLGGSSVSTPQQIPHPTSLYTKMSAAAQIHQRKQVVQPQGILSGTIDTTVPSRPYVHEQRAWPQFQSAQLSSAQHANTMHTPRPYSTLMQGQSILPLVDANAQTPCLYQLQIQSSQHQVEQQKTSQHEILQPQQAQLTSEGHQIPQVPHALPQTAKQCSLQPQRTLPLAITPNSIRSSEFAHLRGKDWSTAAQQRAREIAAKIAAQERDNMTQSIMDRQLSITNQPPGLTSATSMNIPTDHVSQLLPQSHSATNLSDDRTDRVHTNTPSYADAPTYALAPANLLTGTGSQNDYRSTRGTVASTSISGWGMEMPDSGVRLPILAEVRSRYHPSQLQSATVNTADGTLTPTARMCGSLLSQDLPVQTVRAQGPLQVSQDLLFRQPLGVQQSWADGRTDAIQQWIHASDHANGGSVNSWLGGGVDGSSIPKASVARLPFEDEGENDMKIYGK